jgi:Ca2+-binding EF-hand superfamily protein
MLQKVGVDAWLRAHGKTVRPELTKKQKQELKECFDLIDTDGSGKLLMYILFFSFWHIMGSMKEVTSNCVYT